MKKVHEASNSRVPNNLSKLYSLRIPNFRIIDIRFTTLFCVGDSRCGTNFVQQVLATPCGK
jgi:hypothetical protein